MNPVVALVQAQKFCARDLQSVILIYVGAMQVNVVAVLIVPCVRGFDRKNICPELETLATPDINHFHSSEINSGTR